MRWSVRALAGARSDDRAAREGPARAQQRRGHDAGGGPGGAAAGRVRDARLRHRCGAGLALGDHRGVRGDRAGPAGRAVHLRGTAPRDDAQAVRLRRRPRTGAEAVAAKADENGTWITAIDDPYLPIFYATTNLWEYLGQGPGQALGLHRGLPDRRHRGQPAAGPGARPGHRRDRPQGRAHRQRRAQPHVLAAARAAQARGGGRGAHLHPARPPRPTSSGWSGSATATTRGCWRPCRSSTGSSPRPGSATT